MASPAPFPVTVHPYPSPTPNSCAYERGQPTARNALVFVGGLTSGPHATDLTLLAKTLESSASSYSLWEFRMRSSYSGFGYSSLANDVEDTAALVKYLRSLGKEKIVLIGASTGTPTPIPRPSQANLTNPGSQDCLAYANHHRHQPDQAPAVDGYILTSPISDRECTFLFMSPEELDKSVQVAKAMIDDGRQAVPMPVEALPPIFATPVTAYRWHSLAARG